MAVYIKGMEMPETCWDCPCLRHDNMDGVRVYQCNIILMLVPPDEGTWDGKKLKGCPLVEVPEPHGRLIDGDVVRTQQKPAIPPHPIEDDISLSNV